ncbi:hypothetical protein [Oceanobacter sp. 3_MG-2023]|uniref:hypothetical protein n=1 Tax=Oceanobacter sp. 3_MG-2023 TaxID=3062622 RepID=UPI002736D28A|nr:hypothetical protein [Oceanobacter sp. 3_MG-2023]MDP2505724.1 hypothetical protein [Oceanobacter sp. 3_MG-2023]
MVNKTILSLAMAAATAGLVGCNISSVDGNSDVDQTPVQAGSGDSLDAFVSPVFNPATSELPLNIDFLFQTYPTNDDGSAVDATDADGTLYYEAGKDIEPLTATGSINPDYNPVYDAINDLDGFSATAPFDIAFDGELSTEVPSGSVYLVPLNYDGGPKLGSLVSSSPYLYQDIPAIRAEVVSYTDGSLNNNVLRISPEEPLLESTRYLVVVLDSLLGANDNQIDASTQYKYLSDPDLDAYVDELASAKVAIEGWQQLAEGFVGSVLQRNDVNVALAYTFTTGGSTSVMNAMAAPGNANSALSNKDIPALVQHYLNTTDDDATTQMATVTMMTSGDTEAATALIQGNALLSTLPAPAPRKTDFSSSASVPSALLADGLQATFRSGRIELPYYHSAPDGAYSGEDPTSGYACTPTSDTDDSCLSQQLSAANVITSQWQSDAEVISNIQLALGADAATAATYTAPSENVTDLFPFAAAQGTVSAPVLVVEPVASCEKPATGWPVVIYQHGLNSQRLDTLPLADQFAQNCYATVAIDLPLHGVMPTDTVDLSALLGAEFAAVPALAVVEGSENSDNSASSLYALAQTDGTTALLEKVTEIVTAQTYSQRHFGLTADGVAPTAVSATDASANSSGSLYINFVRFQTTRDNTRQAVMDLLNLNASIPFMDIDGDGNGVLNSAPDFDASHIYFAGISLGAIVGTEYVAINNANTLTANAAGNSALNPIQAAVFGVPGGGLAKMLESSDAYGPTIVAGLTDPDSFNLTQGGSDYESLLYVYQATVDASDPVNYAAQLTATGTPYTLIEAVGDHVIPNAVDAAPLAGTDPLIDVLGATLVDTSSDLSASSPVQIAFRLADELSSHSSMAVPDSNDASTETAATFGVIANHIVSLFDDPAAPTLVDDGAGIVEAVTE